MAEEYLVDIKNERLSFFTPAGEVKALNDVSIHLKEGEVLGIVGESGSGKSVTAYSLMGLTAHPGKLMGGTCLLYTSVLDVQIRDGVIYHLVDTPVEVADHVHGKIDWDYRFSNMQQHTGCLLYTSSQCRRRPDSAIPFY